MTADSIVSGSSPSIDPDVTLAKLVEADPQRARIFESMDLDYCCGGARTLAEACDQQDLQVDAVLERLAEVDGQPADEARSWETLSELVDIILEEHHAYLREELGPLSDIVAKVARVHGDNHPELDEVKAHFDELARELPVHLSEEEQILFPAVRQFDADGELDAQKRQVIDALIDGLWEDHEATAEHLEALHDLTDGYAVPDDACPSYRTMLSRLETFQANTHMHVHRENNVLFEAIAERAA